MNTRLSLGLFMETPFITCDIAGSGKSLALDAVTHGVMGVRP